MAERTVIDCDRCGMQAVACAQRVIVQTGWQAGIDGGEPQQEAVDLCPSCLGILLQAEVSSVVFEWATKWIEDIRSHPKRIP